MRNRMYGGVRGRKTKVGEKLLRFPPTRFYNYCFLLSFSFAHIKSFFLEKSLKVSLFVAKTDVYD